MSAPHTNRQGYTSKVVRIGKLSLGGNFPVRIQSMTNTDTNDIEATVKQVVQLAEAGSELVRVTAPGKREAKNLEKIRDRLIRGGVDIPLIADIHFNPAAAEIAAGIVEKIRINPGNYIIGKSPEENISGEKYHEYVLDEISNRLVSLVDICKANNTVIRIGVNHGSLSERILQRYGNTHAGMVESALEYIRIFRELNFNDLVLSLKSSNVKTMVYANRLLVSRFLEENLDYPIHVGVTEAGEGEDGAIRSACGTGALLIDGIGDTIRISLTGDPLTEIPYARIIAEKFGRKGSNDFEPPSGLPLEYHKRKTSGILNTGAENPPVVVAPSGRKEDTFIPDFIPEADNKHISDRSGNSYPLVDTGKAVPGNKCFVKVSLKNERLGFEGIKLKDAILVASMSPKTPIKQVKALFRNLDSERLRQPVIIRMVFEGRDKEQMLVEASAMFSKLMIDGLGDGLWIDAPSYEESGFVQRLSFGILQSLGLRISSTEYIACPSCGRTKFNIHEVLLKVKERTGHLKGLKIAVMGCIVNGPGEMADAHYGYIGSGKGLVTLYRGRMPVRKNVKEENAIDALIELIRESGDWHDP